MGLVLRMLNRERAQYGLKPLRLAAVQSVGTTSCAGSVGHSIAMAQTGSIWHENSQYPRASFPKNICGQHTSVGENVGQSDTGDVAKDLQTLHNLMMSEPHGASTCAQTINHACAILDPTYRYVGIGIVFTKGSSWLTEDFTN